MTVDQPDVLQIFRDTKALLEGHFLLTSGLHSASYFQCAKVFQYPWHAEALCQGIVDHFRTENIDTVVSPAVGGIVVGQETARLLNVRSIFTERKDGEMTLRRGFEIQTKERVLVVEDVTTTGGSVKEVIEVLNQSGADVVGVGAVVDRSGGSVNFGVPYFSLLQLTVEVYPADACPLCAAGSNPIKPGSRDLKK
ncbi:orotate phosphoribosyltransferase [candidate division KSB1 bacterium]|nr:orotate phosphoribosyltransferase [candidate division KSB1 bacterium]